MKPLRPLEIPLEGTQLIEASAGTGKTYTITTLYLRLLLERELSVQEIVVVTFTKAATAELSQRIRKRLREALLQVENQGEPDATLQALLRRAKTPGAVRKRLISALGELDDASVFTIHGFCQRMLTEYAFESKLRFDVDLIADQRELIQELVEDFWGREVTRLDRAKLRYLKAQRFELPAMVTLAATAIQWPDTPLVADADGNQTAAALEHYLLLRSQAATVWRRHGEQIRRLLTSSPALRRGSYKPDTFARWFSELDALFTSQDESLAGFTEAVQRFSRSTLNESTRGGLPAPQHSFFELCEWLLTAQQAAQEAFGQWLIEFKCKLVAFARAEAQRRKLEQGLLSFDDLLHRMQQALSGPRGEALARQIRKRYPAALIDEFQDTDPVQYAVFSRIYRKAPSVLFLIGDPKQAIYGFRGADIFAYLMAVRDAGDSTWTLDTNYRSDDTLVRGFNALFGRPHRPFLLDGIDYVQVKPRPDAGDALSFEGRPASGLELLFLSRESLSDSEPPSVSRPKGRRGFSKTWTDRELPDLLAADIARLLNSETRLNGRPLAPSDIAVLTRTNLQAQNVGQALRRLGIPSALIGDTSVFDSPQAQELHLLLKAMAAPTLSGALKSALCTPSLGVSARELAKLANDESAWERWVERFRELHELWEQRGFVHAMQELLRREQVTPRTLALIDGERRLTNLRHLIELLHQAETDLHLGITGLLTWYDEVRLNPAARLGMAPDAQQIRLESDDHAVQLTTMHKSKGLEYPIVYCPYLWRDANLFPDDEKHLKVHDPDSGHQLKLDIRTSEAKTDALMAAHEESLAEHLRLAYVAITRARHKTILLWGAFSRAEDSPLAHLLYQPPEDLGPLSLTPAARVAHVGDRELLSDLYALREASQNAIQVRLLAFDAGPSYHSEREGLGELAARRLTRSIDRSERISSFSGLAKHPKQVSPLGSIGKDVDETTSAAVVPPPSLPPLELGPVVLAEFPRGPEAGQFLHDILEHADFASADSLTQCAQAQLERYGFDQSQWSQVIPRALGDVLSTRLPGAEDLTLGQISTAQRVSEMEFTLPVCLDRERQKPRVTPASLANVFARHKARVSSDYLGRLRQLGFAPLRGYLRGFIDLVFEHQGKYFVVDYKSNHLGSDASAYEPTRLVPPMEQHHYYLQYHLYVTALHRHLTARLPGYRYEHHFGGVYYLFLRGMSPAYPSGTGVFHDAPASELIEGLSAFFDGAQEVSA